MQLKIEAWGDSQGIRLPKKILAQIGVVYPKDQDVEVTVKNNRLIIEKVMNDQKLDQLFEGFDLEKYQQGRAGTFEYDWGESAGREMW